MSYNKEFITYELETGRICCVGSCPPDVLKSQAQEGQGCIEGTSDSAKFYIDNNEITAKVQSPIVKKGNTFVNILEGTQAVVISTAAEPEFMVVDDGVLSVDKQYAGEPVLVSFNHAKHLLREFTV